MTLHVRFPAGLIDLASADLEVDPDELASVATVVAASAMDLHADELARAIDRTVMRTLFVIGEREDGKMGWSTTCKKKSQEVSYELTREIPRDKGEIGAIDNDVSRLIAHPSTSPQQRYLRRLGREVEIPTQARRSENAFASNGRKSKGKSSPVTR